MSEASLTFAAQTGAVHIAGSGARSLPRTLHIVSTPFPVHTALADWLCERLVRAGAEPVNGVATESWRRLDEFAATPEAVVIVLVDSPAAALSRWRSDERPVESMLSEWCEGVRRMLRLAHRRPRQWLFVDASEALSAPDAFAAALAQLEPLRGLDVRVEVDVDLATKADPIAEVIVEAIVRAQKPAAALFEELRASCIALDGSTTSERTDAHAALGRYRQQVSRIDAMAEQIRRAESDLQQARTWRDERDKAIAERAHVLLALHEVQDEFERFAADSGEARMGTPSRSPSPDLKIFDVEESAPHRHLRCELRGLKLPGRDVELAEVRLIEHRLKPGLALFRQPTGEALLSIWQPDGNEDGRDFMLLIPTDTQGRRRVEQLATSDWRTVKAIARLLEASITAYAAATPRWRIVAARLSLQLDALPLRFRYDSVQAAPDDHDRSATVVRFGNVSFGDRDLAAVELRWMPANRVLEWVAPGASDPLPFGNWPVSESGLPTPRWRFPVGAGASAHKRDQWQALSDVERQLVMSVLDALPAAGGAQLAASAAALHKEARRAIGALAVRQVARRLLGRTV
jgi:hypothetical protein